MLDPNNRPGGPNLVITAKNANKVQFFDAATLAKTGEIQMPASTHELVLSPDGNKVFGSIYGGGRFGNAFDSDRRIAVIDLASKSLERTIDTGELAPHGVMMDGERLWTTAEFVNALIVIDPDSGKAEKIAVGGSAHWVAVSQKRRKVFASFKMDDFIAVLDADDRKPIDRIRIPHRLEGIAISPDGDTLYACSHAKGELHEVDTKSHALRRTVPIEGDDNERQLRRVRVSPDGRYLIVSSNVSRHVAVFEADGLKQIASGPTGKSPMGMGFAGDGRHFYLCCHDDARVMEIELSTGRATREFATDRGCEFVIAYG